METTGPAGQPAMPPTGEPRIHDPLSESRSTTRRDGVSGLRAFPGKNARKLQAGLHSRHEVPGAGGARSRWRGPRVEVASRSVSSPPDRDLTPPRRNLCTWSQVQPLSGFSANSLTRSGVRCVHLKKLTGGNRRCDGGPMCNRLIFLARFRVMRAHPCLTRVAYSQGEGWHR